MTERVLLPQNLYPNHYDISLVPDLVSCTFTAVESINVTVKAETNEVTLHSKEIEVISASFTSDVDSVCHEWVEIIKNKKTNTVLIKFANTLPLGRYYIHVTISYIVHMSISYIVYFSQQIKRLRSCLFKVFCEGWLTGIVSTE